MRELTSAYTDLISATNSSMVYATLGQQTVCIVQIAKETGRPTDGLPIGGDLRVQRLLWLLGDTEGRKIASHFFRDHRPTFLPH
jgi:hypothetical protein